MAFIEWNESLGVDIAEIDGQHQRLVGMINDLHDAMMQRKGADAVGTIIGGLVRYTETHFRTEELYFDQFKYPYAGSHKQEHQDFTRKVAEFQDELARGKLGLSMDVMTFLSTWLQNHIKIIDQRYVPLFKRNGL